MIVPLPVTPKTPAAPNPDPNAVAMKNPNDQCDVPGWLGLNRLTAEKDFKGQCGHSSHSPEKDFKVECDHSHSPGKYYEG